MNRSLVTDNLCRLVGILVCCVSCFYQTVAGQEKNPEVDSKTFTEKKADVPRVGRLIRITLPIARAADERIKQTIDQMLDSLPTNADRPLFVFEFSPPIGRKGSGSQFERCLSLARYLSSERLSRVRTVAYIPRSATGHAVLVALACEEIVIAEDAIFGEAGINESSIGPIMQRGYAEIADKRRTVPAPIALGMLDKELQVYRVTTNSGELIVLANELEQVKSERVVREAKTIIPAGELGKFRGDRLRELGFASYLASDRNELATVLNIPPENLEFDPSMGDAWKAIRVQLSGSIAKGSVDRIINTIQQQQDNRDTNFVCLEIDSDGGSLSDSLRLANFIADLDRSKIRTVAYIAREARADAGIIAFACDHVVAQAEAIIGGYGALTLEEEEVESAMDPIEQMAEKKSRNWSMVAAMLDADLEVFSFRQPETDRRIFACESELFASYGEDALDANRVDHWLKGEPITTEGKVLQLDGNRAEELGFARFVVQGLEDLEQLYQLEETPELIGPNWAYELVAVLASPQVAGMLLFIGVFSLYIELSSPGLGIGGFVATVCFLLYFWANFMNGTVEVLEVLLFAAGLTFIVLEIFVVPGFGIFGIGGGALVLASLILATQTFIIPTNEYQIRQLPISMLTVIGAFAAVIVASIALRKHIHRVPVLSNVMLEPPAGDDREELSRRESLVMYEHLLGQTGQAATRLSPAGKALFGSEVVDVVSDGSLIEKNTPVKVIEVFGNRVTVEAVA